MSLWSRVKTWGHEEPLALDLNPAKPAAPKPATPKVQAPSGTRFMFDNVIGTLQEPGLRPDCPHCGAALAKSGSTQPQVLFNTDRATGDMRLYCPHCTHELQLSELKSPSPPSSPAPKPVPVGGESITLRVRDEQTARNLCNDQHFLLGALMADSSSEAKRFLAALQSGGTYRYEVRRDSVSGACEVKMWMRS